MKHSDRSVSGAIIIFLLVITTYTYILLIVSNNRPLFAQIRVLVHGRTSTRELIAVQNVESRNIGSNRTRGIQKNSLPTTIPQNMTALNLLINSKTGAGALVLQIVFHNKKHTTTPSMFFTKNIVMFQLIRILRTT
jgi:hypothetical protein